MRTIRLQAVRTNFGANQETGFWNDAREFTPQITKLSGKGDGRRGGARDLCTQKSYKLFNPSGLYDARTDMLQERDTPFVNSFLSVNEVEQLAKRKYQ